jgi:hypothetical protein
MTLVVVIRVIEMTSYLLYLSMWPLSQPFNGIKSKVEPDNKHP